MDNKKIGQFISNARKKKVLTQKQLADKLYITDKAISKCNITILWWTNWYDINDNWINYTEIKDLDIPKSLTYTDACLYNKTNNEYNIVPKVVGEYEMYLMLYHKEAKTFELIVYKYVVE